MVSQIIENFLEGSAAAAVNFSLPDGFFQGGHLADAAVELQGVDSGNTIFEKAVDDPVEQFQLPGIDGPADVNGYQQFCRQIIAAAQLLKTAAAVGAHSGKISFAAQ